MATNPVKYEYDPRTGSYYRVSPPIDPVGRIDFQRVHLDRQGYTRQGRYFGIGAPLYEWYDDESGKTFHTRASTRAEAKAHFEKVRRGLVEYGGYNPLDPGTSDLLLIGLGVALLGAVGFAIYQAKQASAAQALANAYQTQAQQSLTQSLQANPFGQ